MCDRSYQNPWEWNDKGPYPYPPTNLELAAYIEREFAQIDMIRCPLLSECDPDSRRRLPCECPLNTRNVNRLDLSYITQCFWGKNYVADKGSTLRTAINNIYTRRNYKSNTLHKFLASELINHFAKSYEVNEKRVVDSKSRGDPLIVTTCFDRTLEETFKRELEPFNLIAYSDQEKSFKYEKWDFMDAGNEELKHIPIDNKQEELSDFLEGRPTILRLYGPLNADANSDQFAITEDHFLDYLIYTEQAARKLPLWIQLRLKNCYLWFVGYNLSYWYLRLILRQIRAMEQTDKEQCQATSWFAFQEYPKHLERQLWAIDKRSELLSTLSIPSMKEYIQMITRNLNIKR